MVIKRIVAYFIDILIVTFAASMLASTSYLNPQLDSYNKVYNEYVEKYEHANLSEFSEELEEISYRLDRNNIYGATISVALTLIYFVIFQKYNNGQTLGKRIMKIKVNGDLSLSKYLLRALILYNAFINILKIGLILTLSKQNYILVNKGLYILALMIEVTTLVMVTMRTDNRGLHDLLVGSDVVQS